MMAMTTSSSIKVNAFAAVRLERSRIGFVERPGRIGCRTFIVVFPKLGQPAKADKSIICDGEFSLEKKRRGRSHTRFRDRPRLSFTRTKSSHVSRRSELTH